MTNPFNNLSSEGLEQQGDRLGGFSVLDTDVYEGEIKAFYAGKSPKGAQFVQANIVLDLGNGQTREYRETLYVTNRDGKNYYHPKDRNGKPDTTKKNPLPGFTTANDIALMATGVALGEQSFEDKVVKLYDRELKAEVPTTVSMATEVVGKRIKLAIFKNIEDKTQDDGSGNYVPTGETRETNTIDKAFHAETGRTVSEVVAGVATGDFINKWLEKNKGQVNNKAKGAEGKSGAPGAKPAGAAPGGAKPAGKSLFG